MGRTEFFIPFVLRAYIVDVFFTVDRNRFPYHAGPAVAAEDQAAEQLNDRIIFASTGVQSENLLHGVKICFWYDRLMAVLDDRPIVHVFADPLMHLVAGRGFLPLGQNADVHRILQDTDNTGSRPERPRIGLEGCCVLHAEGFLVFHRR